MKLIDKDTLVAEIESKRKYAQVLGDNAINSSMQQFYDGMKQGCVDILSFINSLQEEPVSEELKNVAKEYSIIDGADDIEEYARYDIKKYNSFKDGAKWQFERVNEALLSEVLPCFMHGGEADEVVAKLEEVLNQKK